VTPRSSQYGSTTVAWFALYADAKTALAEVLRDEPELEPFLSVEALPLPEPSRN
jgi:hypothetical protein